MESEIPGGAPQPNPSTFLMYTQFPTLDEFISVMQRGKTLPEQMARGMVYPDLLAFSRACGDGYMPQMLENFRRLIKECDCWHCEQLKTHVEITQVDLYFRHVALCCYGTMGMMLN